MQLQISTKPGLIGIQTTPGQLNMESTPARLDMHQKVGRISVETRKPRLEIDQYESRAQLGYKHPSDVSAELAQLGKQAALTYVASKTEEGNRLKAIEKGGNAIREIAIDKAWPQKQRQGGFTPVVGPDFDAERGEVIITPPAVKNATHIGYEAEFVPGRIHINHRRGQVNVYMRQYPEINIEVRI